MFIRIVDRPSNGLVSARLNTFDGEHDLASFSSSQQIWMTVIWKGILYDSFEYLKLNESASEIQANSKIIGVYQGSGYFVEYKITVDRNWNLQQFDLYFEVNDTPTSISGRREKSDWFLDGKLRSDLRGLNYIDISLSPFTNTLPINHLLLESTTEKTVDVMYVNILENQIKHVKQKYRKNSDRIFRFENVPNDFEADIIINEKGLVTFYPSLFEMIVFEKQ